MLALPPAFRAIPFDYCPAMDGVVRLLPLKHGGREFPLPHVGRARVTHRGQRLQHPLRARLADLHACFNRAEVAINISALDPRLPETLAGERQKVVKYKSRGDVALAVNPSELCAQTVPGSSKKVRLGVVESHALADINVLVGQC